MAIRVVGSFLFFNYYYYKVQDQVCGRKEKGQPKAWKRKERRELLLKQYFRKTRKKHDQKELIAISLIKEASTTFSEIRKGGWWPRRKLKQKKKKFEEVTLNGWPGSLLTSTYDVPFLGKISSVEQ